ncbi:hypothetical protein [Vibrio sp. WXL103]|uniref:hypothetical protein n=1 Tax=unclassified Vibrio TaxID=2614977 RepID=UPI003EC4C590
MDLSEQAYEFGFDCKNQGLDFETFLRAFDRSFDSNDEVLAAAMKGFYKED